MAGSDVQVYLIVSSVEDEETTSNRFLSVYARPPMLPRVSKEPEVPSEENVKAPVLLPSASEELSENV